MRALEGLRQITDLEAKEPAFDLVLASLQEALPEVRMDAVEALPSFRENERVLSVLEQALRDPEVHVRCEAANALCFVGRSEGGFDPDPRIAEPLTAALADPNSFVRRRAAESLAMVLGSYSEPGLMDPAVRARATEALLVCLKDDQARVRVAAADALSVGLTHDPRAARGLSSPC